MKHLILSLNVCVMLFVLSVEAQTSVKPATTPAPIATPTAAPTQAPTAGPTQAPTATPAPQQPNYSDCPNIGKELDLSCDCFQSIHRIICTDIKQTFKLDHDYSFKSLVIKNSKNLPRLSENFPLDEQKRLSIDQLIIEQDADSAPIIIDNLEDVLSLSTKVVEINSKDENTKPLDIFGLSRSLTSLTITNLKAVRGFTFEHFNQLKSLILTNVAFIETIVDAQLVDSQLKRISITHTQNLKGSFTLKPAVGSCNEDEKIMIDLRSNAGLEYFDFTHLFTDPKCYYHIDLSGNKLRPTFLMDTVKETDQLNVPAGRFYVVLRDVPDLKCDCSVFKLYQKHKEYVHSVKCQADLDPAKPNIKFLNEFTAADFKDCQ